MKMVKLSKDLNLDSFLELLAIFRKVKMKVCGRASKKTG
jgi:hypothetical protein